MGISSLSQVALKACQSVKRGQTHCKIVLQAVMRATSNHIFHAVAKTPLPPTFPTNLKTVARKCKWADVMIEMARCLDEEQSD